MFQHVQFFICENPSFTKTLKLNFLVSVVFKGTRVLCWVLLFPLVLSDFNTLYDHRIKLHLKIYTTKCTYLPTYTFIKHIYLQCSFRLFLEHDRSGKHRLRNL